MRNVVLRKGQLFARRDSKLRLDDVDAGGQLRHRMLHLQPRVHLDEMERAVLVEELEGACAAIADLAARGDASRPHRFAHVRVDPRRRRLLDHLLVPALHRAVAFAEMHDVAVGVGKDLELDVARVLQVLLEVDGIVAERRAGLGAGERYRVDERRFGTHDTHPAPAAAAGRLHDHRIADVAGGAQRLPRVVADRAVGAGHARNARGPHRRDRGELVPHQPNRFRLRTDEDEAALLDALGKVRVLREKAVAGVDGDRVGHFRRAHHGGDVEVALGRCGGSDAHRLVGKAHVFMSRSAREARRRYGSRTRGRPQDPQRDLSRLAMSTLVSIGSESLSDRRADEDLEAAWLTLLAGLDSARGA